MSESILDWQVFMEMFKFGSVTKAAEALRITPSEASRHIAQLERYLGYTLFDRSVRPCAPTENAKNILINVREMLAQREMLLRSTADKQSASGVIIRIMMGNDYRKLAPGWIHEYVEQVPEQRINVICPAYLDDFQEGKVDLIQLSVEVKGSDIVMIPRGTVLYIPVASPEYLKTHPAIKDPKDVALHRTFGNAYKTRFSFRSPHILKKGALVSTFTSIESVRYSNVEMTVQAVKDGYGIALSLPHFLCVDELEKGTLVPILNGWHRPKVQNYLVCKKETWKLKPIRTFGMWMATKQKAYFKECETRLSALYGKSFLENLKQ